MPWRRRGYSGSISMDRLYDCQVTDGTRYRKHLSIRENATEPTMRPERRFGSSAASFLRRPGAGCSEAGLAARAQVGGGAGGPEGSPAEGILKVGGVEVLESLGVEGQLLGSLSHRGSFPGRGWVHSPRLVSSRGIVP